MNIIDREFHELVNEIKGLREKELYYKIRKAFDLIPLQTKKSCMNFFNKFNYWGKLDIDNGIYEEIELKGKALFEHINDFIWLYNRLMDYRSKKTLFAILSNWYRYDFKTTSQTNLITEKYELTNATDSFGYLLNESFSPILLELEKYADTAVAQAASPLLGHVGYVIVVAGTCLSECAQ